MGQAVGWRRKDPVSFAVGAVLVGALWLLFVPWDLSEIDKAGASTGGGADHHWGSIALVLVTVTVLGMAAGTGRRRVVSGPALTLGGGLSWAALFVWRSAVARTAGANMWPVALVFIVLPALIAAWLLSVVAGVLADRVRPSRPSRG